MNEDIFITDSVEKYGRKYKPATLPSDIARGYPGNCFDWCALQAAKLFPKYGYVEGYATRKTTNERVYHAWLTDGIHAFDPTWLAFDDDGVEFPFPGKYVGIELPFPGVATFMKKTEYQGVLGNYWRAPDLVNGMLSVVK